MTQIKRTLCILFAYCFLSISNVVAPGSGSNSDSAGGANQGENPQGPEGGDDGRPQDEEGHKGNAGDHSDKPERTGTQARSQYGEQHTGQPVYSNQGVDAGTLTEDMMPPPASTIVIKHGLGDITITHDGRGGLSNVTHSAGLKAHIVSKGEGSHEVHISPADQGPPLPAPAGSPTSAWPTSDEGAYSQQAQQAQQAQQPAPSAGPDQGQGFGGSQLDPSVAPQLGYSAEGLQSQPEESAGRGDDIDEFRASHVMLSAPASATPSISGNSVKSTTSSVSRTKRMRQSSAGLIRRAADIVDSPAAANAAQYSSPSTSYAPQRPFSDPFAPAERSFSHEEMSPVADPDLLGQTYSDFHGGPDLHEDLLLDQDPQTHPKPVLIRTPSQNTSALSESGSIHSGSSRSSRQSRGFAGLSRAKSEFGGAASGLASASLGVAKNGLSASIDSLGRSARSGTSAAGHGAAAMRRGVSDMLAEPQVIGHGMLQSHLLCTDPHFVQTLKSYLDNSTKVNIGGEEKLATGILRPQLEGRKLRPAQDVSNHLYTPTEAGRVEIAVYYEIADSPTPSSPLYVMKNNTTNSKNSPYMNVSELGGISEKYAKYYLVIPGDQDLTDGRNILVSGALIIGLWKDAGIPKMKIVDILLANEDTGRDFKGLGESFGAFSYRWFNGGQHMSPLADLSSFALGTNQEPRIINTMGASWNTFVNGFNSTYGVGAIVVVAKHMKAAAQGAGSAFASRASRTWNWTKGGVAGQARNLWKGGSAITSKSAPKAHK